MSGEICRRKDGSRSQLSQRSARSPLVVAILQFVNAQFLKSNCQHKICELVGFKPEELDLYSL